MFLINNSVTEILLGYIWTSWVRSFFARERWYQAGWNFDWSLCPSQIYQPSVADQSDHWIWSRRQLWVGGLLIHIQRLRRQQKSSSKCEEFSPHDANEWYWGNNADVSDSMDLTNTDITSYYSCTVVPPDSSVQRLRSTNQTKRHC